MDSPLLQRIVGAAVLVALGVIFIPALLDGSGYRSRQLHNIQVQEKPDFPPLRKNQVPAIQSPLRSADGKVLKHAVRDKQVASGQKANKKPSSKTKASSAAASGGRKTTDHRGQSIHAFALQVGTFENSDNAEKLREKLQKAGYASFVVPVVDKNKKSYKVRVGPELEKKQLLKIKEKIKKAYKLDGYVVNHP